MFNGPYIIIGQCWNEHGCSNLTVHWFRLSHDETAELADDESEQELDQSYLISTPSPPSSLPVPSIPPATGLFTSPFSQVCAVVL